MIEIFSQDKMTSVLDIWLKASIKAHDFMPANFWQSQVDAMRDIYLPASQVYTFEKDAKTVGFYALYEDTLAAIFVAPDKQGSGIGTQLLTHAKTQRDKLTLNVYQDNVASYRFYLSQGFVVISEGVDEHTGHQEYTMSLQCLRTDS
ncbi:GNAT family N-acetyltransferase [Shewanella kaireitica]|uniref:GNAT family N-acetyltransferase n=1 Tax=Shewanella kaireitica TaxID=212021 RepID=UPI00200FD4A9|nr:GNAT family N-acetyltransferase [Shewanella kaireitica]MCL1093718.1 GNAT family N-acetyltransferase [Shewanella kaireitica]